MQRAVIPTDSLKRDGYSCLAGIAEEELLVLARNLGPVTLDRRHPDPVRYIHPQDALAAGPNTLSSRFGLGRFPFHTDAAHWRTPPRYILLYCTNPGRSRRPTLLIDSAAFDLPSATERMLRRAVWKAAHVAPFLCTVIDDRAGAVQWRYDPGCMSPWSPAAFGARERVQDVIDQACMFAVDWTPGDLLLIDNWRMLHARGTAYTQDYDRKIARVLIGGSQDEQLELRAALAEIQGVH